MVPAASVSKTEHCTALAYESDFASTFLTSRSASASPSSSLARFFPAVASTSTWTLSATVLAVLLEASAATLCSVVSTLSAACCLSPSFLVSASTAAFALASASSRPLSRVGFAESWDDGLTVGMPLSIYQPCLYPHSVPALTYHLCPVRCFCRPYLP